MKTSNDIKKVNLQKVSRHVQLSYSVKEMFNIKELESPLSNQKGLIFKKQKNTYNLNPHKAKDS